MMIRVHGVIKKEVNEKWHMLDIDLPFSKDSHEAIKSVLRSGEANYFIYTIDEIKIEE